MALLIMPPFRADKPAKKHLVSKKKSGKAKAGIEPFGTGITEILVLLTRLGKSILG